MIALLAAVDAVQTKGKKDCFMHPPDFHSIIAQNNVHLLARVHFELPLRPRSV
jgi:hypothetical protein